MSRGRDKGKAGADAIRPAASNWTRSLEGALAYQLRRAQEASFADFARRVGDAPIWPGWYALLKILADNPGIRQTELSQATGRDKSTLTASLRELGKAGLIERVRDAMDRRSYRLELTPAGRRHLAELDRHAVAHNQRIDAIVGPDDRDRLLALLTTLAERLAET